MKRTIAAWAALAGLLLAAPGTAGTAETEGRGDAEAAGEERVVPLGAATRAWMERQRSGVEQSLDPHGLTAPAEHRARTRYLESFTHPIPPLFEREEFGSEER